ncbi:MAG TPA: hypothetical protein VI542_39180 [Candidatus Tectomicrobia bacterium]
MAHIAYHFKTSQLPGNPKRKTALLVNPPVYGTQYWAESAQPYGLLRIARLRAKRVHIAFIHTDHNRRRVPVVVMKPHTYQPFDPLWVIIFRHQPGLFPHPADLVAPTSHGFRGHLNTMGRLGRRGACGTIPGNVAWPDFEYAASGDGGGGVFAPLPRRNPC